MPIFFLHITLGHCFNYKTVTESWRKLGAGYSGQSDSYNNNFNGNDWFRFVEPAGVKLSNVDIGQNACGTHRSGWLRGSDPTIVGQTLDRTVCFSHGPYPCQTDVNIKVSLCSDNNNEKFLIYQLRKPSVSGSGYCAKSN